MTHMSHGWLHTLGHPTYLHAGLKLPEFLIYVALNLLFTAIDDEVTCCGSGLRVCVCFDLCSIFVRFSNAALCGDFVQVVMTESTNKFDQMCTCCFLESMFPKESVFA